MLDQKQFLSALTQISEEKGIPRERVIETIEMAIAAAYKKDYGKRSQTIRAEFNPDTGAMKFFQIKLVVDESMLKKEEPEETKEGSEDLEDKEKKEDGKESDSKKKEKEKEEEKGVEQKREQEEEGDEEIKKIRFNPERHIMLEEARQENPDLAPGDEYVISLETHDEYGRIASQTAKQVILQRLKEAEREAIVTEYKSKEGEILSGVVQRVEGRTVYFDVGRATGVLFPYEQIPREFYRIGNRRRLYLVSVETMPKGSVLILSRSHPKLISRLFELEVPEILDGVVEVKSVAREAGSRTKIAVAATQEGVDPIGSCVGQKGTRVAAVINEIGGEKVDIIEWSEDHSKFIANALSPAKVIEVILSEARREARVMVAEDQLSLAIGKGGQNVRLAARLTGWKIDVRSMQKPEEEVKGGKAETEEEEKVNQVNQASQVNQDKKENNKEKEKINKEEVKEEDGKEKTEKIKKETKKEKNGEEKTAAENKEEVAK